MTEGIKNGIWFGVKAEDATKIVWGSVLLLDKEILVISVELVLGTGRYMWMSFSLQNLHSNLIMPLAHVYNRHSYQAATVL